VTPVKVIFRRLVGQERRSAERRVVPGLVAYYWDGGPPKPHSIREISLTGMYLVTDERWYPGSVLMMRLQQVGSIEADAELTITVYAKAVRHGIDGVGMTFLPLTPADFAESGRHKGDWRQAVAKKFVGKGE
jgi:hypothetical protein